MHLASTLLDCPDALPLPVKSGQDYKQAFRCQALVACVEQPAEKAAWSRVMGKLFVRLPG